MGSNPFDVSAVNSTSVSYENIKVHLVVPLVMLENRAEVKTLGT